MSIKSNNQVETNKYELEIQVDAAKFEEAVQAAYMHARKNIAVDGFRKGKAPRKMIEKLYGEGVFYEDAVNALVPDEMEAALKEAGLEIVARPEIDVTEVSKEAGVTFKAVCIVKPEVTVSDYIGIEVEKVVNAVTDEDVNEQIEHVREKNARMVTVDDRAAQNGDETVIDFEGFIEGVAFDGGKAEKFSLALGSGQFIPGFEDQIVGHNVGDEFDVNVSFPEEYGMKDLAGKPAVFKVKLHEIKMKEMPEVDDEFVKDATEFDTLDAWKDDIRTKQSEYNSKKADSEVENKIFDTVIAKTQAEIPQVMFDSRVDELIHEFEHRLQSQGMNLEIYLQYTNMELDSFKKTFEERAKQEVTLRLALEQIAKNENIEVSDEEVEEELKNMSEAYQMDVKKIKSFVSEDEIKADIRVGKAAKLVRESAKISG